MAALAAGYFALGCLAAISAFTAVVPVRSHPRLGLLCFVLGFPAFHFPGVLLLSGVLLTAAAALGGLFGSPLALAGLAMGTAAMAGLAIVRARAYATRSALQAALDAAIGGNRAAGTPVATEADAGRHVSLNPLRLRQPGVERIADLSYGDAGTRHLLDLYRPLRSAPHSPLPILLWIHGGAWVMGHKAQQALPLMYGMARRGWLAVSINYRLGPSNRFPEPLIDVKRAIAWLRENAEKYGGDPGFVVACGGSAGGHLVALAALTPNLPEYQPGFESADTSLAGAVPLYGRFDFADRHEVVPSRELLMKFLGEQVMPCRYDENPGLWDHASPVARVGPQAPPMFVIHGTHDGLIPLAEAEAFVDALRRVSLQPVAFAVLHGAQHGWDLFNTPWTWPTVDAVSRFAEHLYALHRTRGAARASPGREGSERLAGR